MPDTSQLIATVCFAIALAHTFAAPHVGRAALLTAARRPRLGSLLHWLGEVEIVFGFWAVVFVLITALAGEGAQALRSVASHDYTEPMFVVVVMVVAGSRPVVSVVFGLVDSLARAVPAPSSLARCWLCLALVPLLGSLVTEPAAMTIAALLLSGPVFRADVPSRAKFLALGVLFVNVSIGGTLTSYAAPPVLMVARAWGWDTAYMFTHFGWRAALAVIVNASLATWVLRRHLPEPSPPAGDGDHGEARVPWAVSAVHLAVLAGVVALSHQPVGFVGLFLLFLVLARVFRRYEGALLLRPGLFVGVFLAGLVVLGGPQQWWLQPVVSRLEPLALFFGATALTAITDNAALTYLGSLVHGISDEAKTMLMSGAVAGGGLTVIANAPNPAGAALLRSGFADGSVSVGGLLRGALVPTAVAMVAFLI